MSDDIEPGSRISIKVTRAPTSEAGAKTLSRLFAKDPANRKAKHRRKQMLQHAVELRRRGGRLWAVRPRVPRMFQPTKGASCMLLATPDVIRDLHGVERFVDVSTAT